MSSAQQTDAVMPVASPGGTLLESKVDASQDPLAKLPPPAQQEMKTGSIAFNLGLAPATSDYQNGTVTHAWASGQSEREENLAIAAGTIPQEVQERCARLQELDKACLDSLVHMVNAEASVSTLDDWKRMLLLEKETEVVSLPCVGFQGMPSAALEANAGKGMIMLSKLENDGASPTYRLHFCISRASASLRAEEMWGVQTSGFLCCRSKAQDVKADYHATHKQDFRFATLNVEGNLFHVHGGCEDSVTLASRFGGNGHEARRCSWLRCIYKSYCCPALCHMPCTSGCSRRSDGHFRDSTSFEESLGAYTERIAEESTKESTYNFPTMSLVRDREDRAFVTKQLHCIHLVYRDTATNCTQSCIAVVEPDAPMSNIAKFVSSLSPKQTADPARAKSEPWSSAKPLKSLFGSRKM